jgi:LPXTG-motif cell wall-anchored protein
VRLHKIFYALSTFDHDEKLTVLDVSKWDTSKVNNMYATFNCMYAVKVLDVSNWNTSKVTTMGVLFQETRVVKVLDISKWDTSQVDNMAFMFHNSAVEALDVASWNVAKVKSFYGTFEGIHISGLDLSNWNTISATEMHYMFAGSSFNEHLDVSGLDTQNVTTMEYMFSGVAESSLDVSSFNTSNVEHMAGMFMNMKNLSRLDISNFDMSKMTQQNDMLKGLTSLKVLVLGPKTVINSSNLSNLNFDGTSNHWIAVNGGTEDDPKGDQVYTSDELMAAYDGSTMGDTYVIAPDKSSVEGHDSTVTAGPNQKWNPADNFTGATDIYGNPITVDDVKVMVEDADGLPCDTVDETQPGDYQVTYYYKDEFGTVFTSIVTVHVIASQASIDGTDSTIYAGPNQKWNPADNFTSATDAKGNPVDFKDVTVDGTVDATKAGKYQVTYSYTDEFGNVVSKTVTVTVLASQASIDGTDSTIIAGPNQTWSPVDNFKGATDAKGNPIDFSDPNVSYSGTVDATTPGKYEITYSYTDEFGNVVSKKITVTVIASQASVDGKDSTVVAGPDKKWNPADNFTGATDAKGNPVDLKDVKVNGTVDETKAGVYQVTYSYTDEFGNVVSKTVTVTAGPDQKWNPADNFDGATDENGNPVDIKDVKVDGTVNPQKPGKYEITYSYTDEFGKTVSKTVTVTVVASPASVDGHDSTIIAGPNQKWDPADNFDGAIDENGDPVDLANVKVDGTVDPTKPGEYEITYTYTDSLGNVVSKKVTVTVLEAKTNIEGHDSTVIAGPNKKWNPADNFNEATDEAGNPIDIKYVKVDGTVDETKPGSYDVTYSYTDKLGNEVSTTVTVTVVKGDASVDGHDSTIVAGPDQKWNPADNFNSATDAEGNPVNFKDVEVSGEVDPTTAGSYDVTYTYTDEFGNVVSDTVTVTVVASPASVDGHDSNIIAGPDKKWNPADNFNNATDAQGDPVDIKDVKVSGTVDETKPGTYDVTYSYTDEFGNVVSDTITITVVASPASVEGHDSTVVAGPDKQWNPADNFDGATDAEGNPVDLKDVTVDGTVDETKAGTYNVTYTYTDEFGNVVSDTVTVTVLESEANVDGHDSTIVAGPDQKWSPADNFDGATDAEGNPVDLKDVTVDGTVDPTKAGVYEITYSYTDANGNTVSTTVKVTVVDNKTSIDGHDSSMIADPDAKWSPADNFDGATDAEGNPVDIDDVTVDGTVDPTKAGDYDVTYSYTDAAGNQVHVDVTVHVYPADIIVNPDDPKVPDTPINPNDPDSPDYPSGVDYDDLNRDVTEKVHYVDAETGEELAETYTRTVHYGRKAYVHYDKNGNATVTYGDWTVEGDGFEAVTSPDIDGYFTNRTQVDAYNPDLSGDEIANDEQTVLYYKQDQTVDPDDPKVPDTPINPNDPDSPDYPSGVDYDDLNRDVTEKVHYVDAETGEELAETYTRTVHYGRKAYVHYDKNGNATVTYGDWTVEGDGFEAVTSPDIDGYFTNRTQVDAYNPDLSGDEIANDEQTVLYYKQDQTVDPDDPKVPDTPINPNDPDSPVYPAGVDVNDLNKDQKETIHYVDGETGKELAETYTHTVHYSRKAYVHYDKNGNATVTYGDWVADGDFGSVTSPDIDGYFNTRSAVSETASADGSDIDVTVYYYKQDQTVDPDDPKHDGDKVYPDSDDPNSPVYPAGVDVNDLNKDQKETIHYVDGETGKELAGTYTHTVHYSRKAYVHYDKNGNATVTYGDWVADGDFGSVASPDIDGYFNTRSEVSETASADGSDIDVTVYYYKQDQTVDPDDSKHDGDKVYPDSDDPNSPVYPAGVDENDLNRDVTETIHYVDGETGKELAETYTHTVHYSRKAYVHYDKNGNATVTYGEWVADGTFDAVDSPDIDGYTPDQTTVDGFEVTDPIDGDVTVTVSYQVDHQAAPVVPDDPTPAPEPKPEPKPTPAPEPATPAKPAEKAVTPAPQKQALVAKAGNVAKRLPQTGEEDNTSINAVGVLGLLAGTLGLFGLGKKRKRDGED